MAHQAGFTNVVCSMGTALTAGQVELLTRYAPRIALAYDVDAAGQERGHVRRDGADRARRARSSARRTAAASPTWTSSACRTGATPTRSSATTPRPGAPRPSRRSRSWSSSSTAPRRATTSARCAGRERLVAAVLPTLRHDRRPRAPRRLPPAARAPLRRRRAHAARGPAPARAADQPGGRPGERGAGRQPHQPRGRHGPAGRPRPASRRPGARAGGGDAAAARCCSTRGSRADRSPARRRDSS